VTTATYKVGTNKGRPRIWIDGKKLKEAGFTGGVTYFAHTSAGSIRCTLEAPQTTVNTPGRITGRKVTGRPDGKPIIDILGKDVETAFANIERVQVTFEKGAIVIVADK
jgi:DNA (cytosine-5)-methyltransferase 1